MADSESNRIIKDTAVKKSVGFISLGCPKALVDSERILTQLRTDGYEISPSYAGADVVVVNTCGFIDEAIQVHGATGVSQWTPLSRMYASQRTLRLADGPDEVHWHVVGRNEISRYEGEDNDTTRAARTQEGLFSGPA